MRAMRRLTCLTLALSLGTSLASAHTWHVEKDGSGDFAIIYEAVDAAASGDTIQIGPGRFEDYRLETDYAWETYCCAHTSTKDLTFIGAGANETTIGFEHFDPQYPYYVIGISSAYHDLTVEDLAVIGLSEGVTTWQVESLVVRRCHVVECDLGIIMYSLANTEISHCQIAETLHIGIVGWGPNGVNIQHCEFIGASQFAIAGVGGDGWAIRDTEIHGGPGGIQFSGNATGTVERCQVTVAGGYSPALGLLDGTTFYLVDSTFEGELWAAHFATGGTTVTSRQCIFIGGSYGSVEINLTPMDFHQNHIINGGGPSVRGFWYRGNLTEPVVIDLTENYWGTTDPQQIAAWIDDYHDHDPDDTAWYVIIDFEPFADQPVRTETASWGAVKSLFR